MRIFAIIDLILLLSGCISLMSAAPAAIGVPVFPLLLIFFGLILLILLGFYTDKHIRCPHCGKKLRFRGIFDTPKFCAECGEKLDL